MFLNAADAEMKRAGRGAEPTGKPAVEGSIGAAWASPAFRRLYVGSTLSLVGTWLQNVIVAPFALDLTRSASNPKGSASFVGLLTVAQLGPLLNGAAFPRIVPERVCRCGPSCGSCACHRVGSMTGAGGSRRVRSTISRPVPAHRRLD